MKYYVLHKEYTEYNQFEGSWDDTYTTFDDVEKAKRFAESLSEYTFIAGPLVAIKDET